MVVTDGHIGGLYNPPALERRRRADLRRIYLLLGIVPPLAADVAAGRNGGSVEPQIGVAAAGFRSAMRAGRLPIEVSTVRLYSVHGVRPLGSGVAVGPAEKWPQARDGGGNDGNVELHDGPDGKVCGVPEEVEIFSVGSEIVDSDGTGGGSAGSWFVGCQLERAGNGRERLTKVQGQEYPAHCI